VLGLLPPGARVEGSVRFDGHEVLRMPPSELRAYRASRAAIVFQDPRAHINPLRTVGDFLTEGLRLNQGLAKRASRTGPASCSAPSASRIPGAAWPTTPTSCPVASSSAS
jgi:ABC-type microcin C transport system duplicated ATPase subunit YejF